MRASDSGISATRRRATPSAALRPLVSRLATGGMILAYHGVRGNDATDPGSMHVSLATFVATMRAVAAVATYVPLRELLERHRGGEPTRGLVAVTFDDAYASVAGAPWSAIVEQAIPITLFVISRGAASGQPFWWDRVDECFRRATPARWHSFETECGMPEAFRAGQPASMGRLRPFRQWILAEHRGRWPAMLDEPLASLEAELGSPPTQRPLTYAELDELVRNPLLDVGLHTVSHPVLPLLPDEELRQEVGGNLRELRSRYPRALPVLSVPYGLYDQRTVRVALEEGVSTCLTLGATLLGRSTPCETVPRIGIMQGHQPWKTALSAIGCWRGVRPSSRPPRYPDLPSATT